MQFDERFLPRSLQVLTSSLLDGAADLFLGWRCAGCGAPGPSVCPSCDQLVQRSQPFHQQLTNGLTVLACSPYELPQAQLLIAYKDRGAWQLNRYLANQMTQKLSRASRENQTVLDQPKTLDQPNHFDQPNTFDQHSQTVLGSDTTLSRRVATRSPGLLLCPVPSNPVAVKQRGFDHCAVLTRALGRRLRIPSAKLLYRNKTVRDQAALNREQRQTNLTGAMRATRAAHPPEQVILVDDICTTGATLSEASRALSKAGFRVRGAIVFSAVELRQTKMFT